MKRILFFLISIMCFAQYALAQPATYSVPISIGRNNCGGGGTTKDSVYFFNYVSGSLTRASYPNAYKPRLKIGPISTVDRWSIFAASISYNPKDQKLYYLWTDYSNTIRPTGTWTYIWRWKPDTTFTVGATLTTNYIDTLRSFPYDIGGVAFDNNGTGWTLEFPSVMPATRAFFRPIDFAAGIYNPADTLDFVPSTGLGSKLYNVGSGDITMMPSGQIYYNFDNKLYTPDYGSYGGATHHIKSTFIDTTRRPTGSSALVGLAFGDGDLISSYATGCLYRRLDPVTGDTNFVSYTYSAGKGVYSVDMTQLTSGVGASKKLISVTPTGTPNQYDVIYDVFVRNYGTTPITNVQVTDNLSLINGLANVSNVTATLTSNPAGVSLNPLYNGTIITTLLAPAQTLPNYPSSNNNFTIRISCRLSNIQQGVVYYNQAVTTANGFNNTALRDSSTNGNNPDLNQNDKPDDAGESQPTPFVVILTPITPPCATLAQTLYSQDFGSGTGMNNNIPSSVAVPSASTTFIGTAATPMPVNRFTVTNNAINGDGSNWVNLTDHTGGANGRMLLINADAAARIAYADTMPVVCPGQQYSVSFWAAFVGNSAYKSVCDGLGGFKYSQLLVRVRDLTTGLVITQYTTDTIKLTSWQQHGMKWVMPAGYSQVILELVNAAPGGCGNDFALDDIQFGICDPVPTVSLSGPGACLNSSVTFTSALSDASIIPGAKDYQWQWSPAPGSGPWTNIAGATSSTYTINPVNPADTGRFYRVIVAAQGNIGNATCQYISTGLKLNGFAPSTAPASISAPAATVCNNGMVTVLTATGGTLGTGANYQWGTGSVVGTNPIPGATFSTLTVSPTSTTTYWVRIENTSSPCTATTGGVTTTITVNQPSTAPSSINGSDICNGSSVTLAALGGTLGTGANYQWGTGAVIGTNPIAGATGSTLTVSPTSTTTYWVRIENTTAPCSATTGGLTKVITVNQPSTGPASISAPSAIICNGSSVTLTAVGGTLGTGANYQWGTGSVVGTSPIGGATGSTLTVSPTSTTTYWVRVENTTAPCAATTGGVTTTITVNQPSTAPSSVTGLDICNGSSTTLTAVGGTLGTGANYQWGTGAVVGTSPIVGATSSTLTVSPTSTTTYWVRIENNAGPCSATTSGLTKVITVRQPSTAPSSVTGLDICNGSSTTLTAVGGTLGTGANYQWGTGAVVGTSPIVGATFSTLTVSPTSTTTYWVRIENTTAPCSATTSGLTKVITVNQPSTAPSSVSGSDICNGSSVTLTAVGGTLGTGANYQWGTGAVVGTSPIVGATSSTLTVSPTSTTTYWVRIENTTAPCSATTSGLTKVITVNQPSTAPSSVTGLDICNGSSTTLTAIGGTLGTGANYQWGTGAVVGTSPIVGATGSTLTVSPTSTTTYWVRIENTTAPCGATTSGLTKVITVRQPSTAPSSVSGSDICNGSSVTLTAVGGTLGTGANYQWGTGAVVGTSPIVGATSSTLTVSPTSTTTYWVRIENTTAPCSATTSGLTKVITVNQPSTAPSSVTGLDICNGSSTTLTAIGGTLGTGANYQWGTGAVVGTNPIVGATGSTLTVSPTSTTTYWVRIENTTGPCATNTSGLTKVITVSQPSVAASSANKNKNNVCPGISVQLSAAGGTLGTGASWKWYTGSPGGTLVGTGATLTVTPAVTTTYYVRAEGSCNTTAAAAVTVTINCDIDKDDDGIPDFVESNMAAAFADANSNGVINAYDPTYAGFVDYNNDFVNDNFQADGDSDNDGIPNYMDTDFPGRVDTNGDGIDDRFDQDKDGVINMLDLDSDNDGIPDVVEAYGVDTNGDGKIDNLTDTDGDGLSDNVDTRINAADGAYNTGTGLGVINLDGDAWPNFLDLDSDNDGIPDVREVFGADANNNGIIDGFVDVNGDGLHDSYINAGALLLTGADGNNDGRADSWPNKNLDRDLRPNAYDLDSDGDGIVDAIEAGGGITDANLDGLADGSLVNGWSSSVSALSSLTLRNTDSNGNPDYLDIDSDNDGIPDNIEGMSTAGYQLPTTTDTDGDGLASPYDNLVGFGGSGIFVYDNDGDGTPDYRDLDTDGDGSPDLCEGNDWNLNGMCDEILVLTNIDTDGDGLDNLFDSLNSVTNLKGTSYMMGNGGSLIGDAAPGTRATVQKKTVAQGDRDWRWTATVLPVQFLSFTGVMQNTIVDLNWSIITSKAIDRFEIERSTDNASFSKVGTVTDAVQLNIQQGFGFADDISGINSDIFYYRLKAIGKSGEFKYSNILVVRRSQVKTPVSIMPNPANDYVTVRFYVEKEQEVTIRLVDNVGKTVLQQKQKAAKGSNAVQLTNLAKYSTGLYSVQVLVNGELVTQKLLVSH